MKTSQGGIDLIKSLEGFRANAYKDIAGVWTIGYGATKNVYKGEVISEKEADKLLLEYINLIDKHIETTIKVSLNQNQHDALVCFIYNVGIPAFSKSILKKLIRNKAYEKAAEQFMVWDKVKKIDKNGNIVFEEYINGEGIKFKRPVLIEAEGLKNRRMEEKELFLKPVA
jgi:lysozyme